VQHVRQRLGARFPKRDSGVCPRRFEKRVHRADTGRLFALAVQTHRAAEAPRRPAQHLRHVGLFDRRARVWSQRVQLAQRMPEISSASSPSAKNGPLSVANTDSSSSGHSIARIAVRSAITSSREVKASPADQHMRDAPSLQRLGIGPREIGAAIPAKRLNRIAQCRWLDRHPRPRSSTVHPLLVTRTR